ncbi:unnamed protein product [Rotaria sp. Silwood2]|nr:unnamed protein product [Rotaria sp. Silwood2]CAF2765182.1 unnamed protein product [Rotaria sp. Silwood2]CAF4396535.1 unnamed protein product [Rotaria sp. Silwood2]CAF4500139.1 unnamed protein product [Rotaria sp. Silwood2]
MSLHNNVSSSKQLEPCYILQPLGYYLFIIWIIGTSLNGYVLCLFIRYKNLRQSSTNIFICGLVLADFCGALFEIPLPAIALVGCRWIFSYVGCIVEAIIAYFASCSNIYMLCLISLESGYLLAWTPYAIMSFICAFIDDEFFPPILGTIPALFAKTSVVWNPLIYVARNGNIRHYFSFRRHNRSNEKNRTPDATRYSLHPSSTAQLQLR